MEFEDMKKIWDEQNEESLYAFDEEALHRNIRSKKKGAVRKTNFNDFGLIVICIITAITYSFLRILNGTPNIYDYMIVAILLLSIGFLWAGRVRRKKKEQTFGRTVLSDLDRAISSVTYEMKRLKIMVWWLALPLLILIIQNMSQADPSFWTWVIVVSGFVLYLLVLRRDYNRCQKPKKQKLEALRDKLTEKTEGEPL